MPFPPDAPGKIHAKVEDGRLPLELPARFGSEKPCDGCGEAISSSQVEYEFESREGRTIRLHLGCASLLEAERRRRSSP
jgi:hypothetical protein